MYRVFFSVGWMEKKNVKTLIWKHRTLFWKQELAPLGEGSSVYFLRTRKKVGKYCGKGSDPERRNEVLVCPHLNMSPLKKLFLTNYAIDMRRYMM